MGSIRTAELVQKITKTSVTTISLPSGSRLNIGAQQYSLASALTLNTAVTGIGGCDAAIQAGQLYYVYAVVSAGTVYLIASLNASLPAGFTLARAVGGFTTNASSQIDQVGEYPGNLAVAGSVSAGGGVAVQDTSNFIINGGFDFFQRSASAIALDGTPTYRNADRYQSWYSGAVFNSVTIGRDASAPNSNTKYSLVIAANPTATSGSARVSQKIEAANTRALVGKTVTFGFWYKSASSSVMFVSCRYPTTTEDDFSAVTTFHSPTVDITPDNVWRFYSTTFSVPAEVSRGMAIFVDFGMTGRWANTGAVYNHYLSQMMLNIGTSAAPFKRAGGTVGGELQLCQRYFELVGVSGLLLVYNATAGFQNHYGYTYFSKKRIKPDSISIPAINYQPGGANVTPVAAIITDCGMSIYAAGIPASYPVGYVNTQDVYASVSAEL